jgi:hypothetical protein
MPNKRKELYCGDTVNTLGREDHTFQWSEAFKWYTTLPLEENNSNKVWTSGITLQVVCWKYQTSRSSFSGVLITSTMKRGLFSCRGRLLFLLAPTMFRRMLRLLEPTTIFKSSEADAFLKANHGGTKILDNFLLKPLEYSENSTHIEVCSLKYPYKEFRLVIHQNYWAGIYDYYPKICIVCLAPLCP